MACCCLSSAPSSSCPHHIIGSHYDNASAILQAFSSQKMISPVQTMAPSEAQDKETLKQIVSAYSCPHFLHAPHNMNLCSSPSRYPAKIPKLTPEGWKESDFWAVTSVVKEMELASELGSRGVVVHTGTTANRFTAEEGTKRMETMVRRILDRSIAAPNKPSPLLPGQQPGANSNIPMLLSGQQPGTNKASPMLLSGHSSGTNSNIPMLLLETPVGEGHEICARVEEMGKFYESLVMDYAGRLGLCVDTCHVFAAGYEPMEYLKYWDIMYPRSIQLVHFNDSMGEKMCHLDRHAHWNSGMGKMGKAKMEEIRHWCHQHQIPMVVE